jgi:hypothetical protein
MQNVQNENGALMQHISAAARCHPHRYTQASSFACSSLNKLVYVVMDFYCLPWAQYVAEHFDRATCQRCMKSGRRGHASLMAARIVGIRSMEVAREGDVVCEPHTIARNGAEREHRSHQASNRQQSNQFHQKQLTLVYTTSYAKSYLHGWRHRPLRRGNSLRCRRPHRSGGCD